MRYALLISGLYNSNGTEYLFLSHDTAPNPGTLSVLVRHAICSVGAMTSTIDPAEAIVDSSSFSVELACDADCEIDASRTVREIFSRAPNVYGRIKGSRRHGTAGTIQFSSAASIGSPIQINIGVSSYTYTQVLYSGGISTGTGVLKALSQDSYQYYDKELDIGPEVTTYPTVWKGRLCYLWVTNPLDEDSWLLYRVGMMADNPTMGLSSVTISISPLDSHMLDQHASSPADYAQKLSGKNRSYAGTRDHFVFSEAYIGAGQTYLPTWSSGRATFNSGSSLYLDVFNTIPPQTAGTIYGTSLGNSEYEKICTPCNPPVDISTATASSFPAVTGRDASYLYLNLTPTSDSYLRVLPTARWYRTAAQTPAAIDTRTQTRVSSPTSLSDCEPLVRAMYVSSQIGSVTELIPVLSSPYVSRTPVPLYFGLTWEETVDEPITRSSDMTVAESAHSFRWVVNCRLPAWSWETPETWTSFCDSANIYGIKLLEPELSTAISSTRVRSLRDRRGASCVDCHVGYVPMNQFSSIKIAVSSNCWCRGEKFITFNDEFSPGETDPFWLTAKWTEDGEKFFERRLKVVYYDSPPVQPGENPFYVYEILIPPKCAGIGDWFGHTATFVEDMTVSASNDALLLWRYLYRWMRFPVARIDDDSLHSITVPLAVDEFIYETPEKLADTLPGLLLMSGTCLSFSVNGEYKLARKWIGRADKSEPYVTVTDDVILSPPTCSRDDHIVSTYHIAMPEEVGDITYIDRAAKDLYSDSETIDIDLSACEISDAGALKMRATLQNLVWSLGSERVKWSFSVPYDIGWKICPGDLINLTCSLTVGVQTPTPPSNVPCRVLGVTQDPVGYTTSLDVMATETGAAKYQRGCVVLDFDGTSTYTVDDATWVTDGMTIYCQQGQTTVTSHTGTTIVTSQTGWYVSAWWRYYESARFVTASDYLG